MAEFGEPEKSLSTTELLKHALAEAKLLARAEVAHAKLELRQDLHEATRAGVALGVALTLALCGLSVSFVAIAMALPMKAWAASLLVGLLLLAIAGITGFVGYKKLPKRPMERTRVRLMSDLVTTRERFA